MATARSRVLHPGPSYCGAQRARAGVRRRRRQPGTPAPPGAPRSGCSRSIRWAAVSKETTEDSAHRPQVSRALVGSAEGQCPLWVVSFLTCTCPSPALELVGTSTSMCRYIIFFAVKRQKLVSVFPGR